MSGITESVVARCLVDPEFVEDMVENSTSALASYDLAREDVAELASLDVERVKRFAGFICKVQHNHLWQWFPATRGLMVHYGIELQVFAKYRRVQCTDHWASLGRNDRIHSFIDFLLQLVANRERATQPCPGLKEVATHERMRWEVSLDEDPCLPGLEFDAASVRKLAWRDVSKLVPHVPKAFRIRSFMTDPVAIAERVRSGTFDGTLDRASTKTLLYWPDSTGEAVHLHDVDALAANLLLESNGRRSIRTVVERIRRKGLREVPPSALRSLFEDASSRGILSLRREC